MHQTGLLLACCSCTMIDVMLNVLFQLSAVAGKFLWVKNAIRYSVDIALITVCLNKGMQIKHSVVLVVFVLSDLKDPSAKTTY